MAFLDELKSLLGPYALTDPRQTQGYCTDERSRYHGKALAVALPENHEQVQAVLALAKRFSVPVVAQGGNTSTVGGSVPCLEQPSLILSLKRMNKILRIDPVNDTIYAQAGVSLQALHEAADSVDRLFPLTLGSQGSASLGGLLACNAGGTQVLRYGMMRDLTLGYRAVLADARSINELSGLRKNNSGYDLRDLLIGSEGTLAIFTEAVIKLYPKPTHRRTLMLSLSRLKSVENVFSRFNDTFHAQLTAFELMGASTLNKLQEQLPQVRQPQIARTPWWVFLELSFFDQSQVQETLLESVLAQLFEQDEIRDGVIAQSEQDCLDFWAVREMIPPAHKKGGGNVKHDISVPRSRLVDFIESVCQSLQERYPWLEPSIFGHYGDGNLHFNMGVKPGLDPKIVFAHEADIHEYVYARVLEFDGSISAEHGVGQLKREALLKAKDPVALELMGQIKKVFDPENRLNTHKVLPLKLLH